LPSVLSIWIQSGSVASNDKPIPAADNAVKEDSVDQNDMPMPPEVTFENKEATEV
jgi:hypothetical protein